MRPPERKEGAAPPPIDKPPQILPTPDSEEPAGIERDIADADKKVRTGSTTEPVRSTPPAGAWNDTSGD